MAVPRSTDQQAMIGVLDVHALANMVVRTHADLVRKHFIPPFRGGEVIIGDIGYRDHQVVTALGDAVNVAARDMTKGLECEVIVSEEIYKSAGLPVNLLPEQELSIRRTRRAHGCPPCCKCKDICPHRDSPSSPRKIAAGIIGTKSFQEIVCAF